MSLNDKDKSLEVMILNSYIEYRDNNYPTDPKIYQVRGNIDTVNSIIVYFENRTYIPNIYVDAKVELLTTKFVIEPWGFTLVIDNRLRVGEIVFGPEQIELKWTSKD